MTTALAITQPQTSLSINDINQLSREHYGKTLTPDQWAMFVVTANTVGLSIASKQIYAIVRESKGQKVMTAQIGIDGARAIAHRHNMFDGCDSPQWCGKDGIWRDVWDSEVVAGKRPMPVAARVTVYRKGSSRGFTAIATYAEYAQTNNSMWQDMPANQLRKCAEAQALRMAFPFELSGVYVDDEMHQADNTTTAEARNQLATALEAIDNAFDVGELLGPVKVLCEALKGAERVEAREVFTAKLKELQAAVQRDTKEMEQAK